MPTPRADDRPAMTDAQRRVYEFVRKYWLAHGAAPTVRQIVKEFGFAGNNSASCHLVPLVKKGWLRRVQIHRTGPKGGFGYAPVDSEIVATLRPQGVRVVISGPDATLSLPAWRSWLLAQLEKASGHEKGEPQCARG
jgi:hypothetical protein